MKDKGFAEYVVGDLFGYLDDVSARAMFGGYGIYRGGVMFGLIAEGELYFKVSEGETKKYESFSSKPFHYSRKDKGAITMSYWCIPEEVQEDTRLFRELAEESYELALEKAVKKTPKKKASGK